MAVLALVGRCRLLGDCADVAPSPANHHHGVIGMHCADALGKYLSWPDPTKWSMRCSLENTGRSSSALTFNVLQHFVTVDCMNTTPYRSQVPPSRIAQYSAARLYPYKVIANFIHDLGQVSIFHCKHSEPFRKPSKSLQLNAAKDAPGRRAKFVPTDSQCTTHGWVGPSYLNHILMVTSFRESGNHGCGV